MAKLEIKKGSTDVTVYVFIQDSSSTTGAGLTGLTHSSSGLTCYYVRPLGNATQLTLASQTVTGAHTDGGFVEVSAVNMPGVYRLDLADAVVATGANSVAVMLHGAANMAPVLLELMLVSYDPHDGTRLGLTALPNAAAESIGGLYTRGTGAGQIDQPANGRIAVDVVAISGDTVAADNAETAFDGGSYNVGGGAIVAASVSGSVGGVATDGITAASIADGAIDRATFAVDTGLRTVRSGTAQAGSSTTITLDASASSDSDFYNDLLVYITSGTGTGQVRRIDDYDGTTKVASITPVWTITPDSTSTFVLLPTVSIWDELLSSHLDSSTAGSVLNAVGSADPWAVALPGSYGAGTAGHIIGNRLDTTVSSRLAPTVAGRTLDVSIGGEAGVDWSNVGNTTASVNLTNTAVGSVVALGTTAKADVNAEIVDAIAVDMIPELTGDPGATPTLVKALMLLYMKLRNKETSSSTTATIANNAGTTIMSSARSDDGSVFTKERYG